MEDRGFGLSQPACISGTRPASDPIGCDRRSSRVLFLLPTWFGTVAMLLDDTRYFELNSYHVLCPHALPVGFVETLQCIGRIEHDVN
jgi:hypothetical protein